MKEKLNIQDEGEKIFTEVVVIDWYDGPIIALVKTLNPLQSYLASVVYFNTQTNERIFQLIKVEETWGMQILDDIQLDKYDVTKERIKNKFQQNISDLYVIKGQYLNGISLRVKKISVDNLKYYPELEEVIQQDQLHSQKWLNFFD
ncbi:hypothetical protein DC498_22215 [Terrimonas sp.]|uniref:hypothetical protein n=1 Tax=Terrimonas sp. TaxID=1914338 RepID=UPI000D50F2C7|nr:hypothetical protein [Terrimonas sp.]PVD50037.1 hypothetical protein DC498_22215 [Terrimonas sp.]